ncbi:AQPN [Lepeophtheirus salmonis]|uniref:AQPN n=1 Tax=Lepeophtheirus salmonis TaxID=72036 RepID=A0A7R8D715_LEPSM|nr:AQPN [Lepeophtheirus salmonis]CAF2995642.1 AQPN [Lepeophtheirus salmonis]
MCLKPCHLSVLCSNVDENGEIISHLCDRKYCILSQRNGAKRSMELFSEKMKESSNKRFNPVVVCDSVMVPIDLVDRGKAEFSNIKVVAMEEDVNGNQFTTCEDKFDSCNLVPLEKEVALRKVARMESISLGRGVSNAIALENATKIVSIIWNRFDYLTCYNSERTASLKRGIVFLRYSLPQLNTSISPKQVLHWDNMPSRFILALPKIGLDEIKNPLWLIKCFMAEFIGTFILVLIGCGSCIGGHSAEIVRISFAFGIGVANSSSELRSYIRVSCESCSLAAAFILYLISNKSVRGADRIGMTSIDENLNQLQGFAVEFFIVFILVLVVFGAAADENNEVKGSAPLAIGLAITCCHLLAIPFTGSSMNPARTFGPAVILNDWKDHWVYWVGPIMGGVAASYTYQLFFQAPSKQRPSHSLAERIRNC